MFGKIGSTLMNGSFKGGVSSPIPYKCAHEFFKGFSSDSEDSGEIPEIIIRYFEIPEISVGFQRFFPSK